MRKPNVWFYIRFLGPALLIYGVFFVYPTLLSFKICAYKWSGYNINNMEFVGLENLIEVLHDSLFLRSLINNLLIIVGGGVALFSLALFFAAVLTRRQDKGAIEIKGANFFETIIFFPYTISAVVVGILWGLIFAPRFGALNGFLRWINLDFLTRSWLGERITAIPAITFVVIWSVIGFYFVLFSAGIKQIPKEYYESAKIDGANEGILFWNITLPLLKEVISVTVMFWVIFTLKLFSQIWAMYSGHIPAENHTILTYLFSVAIGEQNAVQRLGYGTAIGVVLFIIVMIFSILYGKLTSKEVTEY